MFLDVSNTKVECYSGCLTTARIIIKGASNWCPDGSIMKFFGITVGIFGVVALIVTLYHVRRVKSPSSTKISFFQECYALFGYSVIISNLDFSFIVKYDDIFICYDYVFCLIYRIKSRIGSLAQQNGVMVVLSFVKLVCIILLSLFQNNWWSYGGDRNIKRNHEVVESCSSPTHCFSFCPGYITNFTAYIHDDTLNNIFNKSYCSANLPGYCGYEYWLIFKLVPLLVHFLVLIMQCCCLFLYKSFTPQTVQYGIICKYLIVDLESGNEENFDKVDIIVEPARGEERFNSDNHYVQIELETKPESFLSMLEQLVEHPLYSIFPFLEFATAVYVWGELLFPSTSCSSITPLSAYYYPILMTIFDMSKFNFYVASRYLKCRKYWKAVTVPLNLYYFFFYIMVSVLLGIHFASTLLLMPCMTANSRIVKRKHEFVEKTVLFDYDIELANCQVNSADNSENVHDFQGARIVTVAAAEDPEKTLAVSNKCDDVQEI